MSAPVKLFTPANSVGFTSEEWDAYWGGLSPTEQESIRSKASHEHMTLSAVAREWGAVADETPKAGDRCEVKFVRGWEPGWVVVSIRDAEDRPYRVDLRSEIHPLMEIRQAAPECVRLNAVDSSRGRG